MSKFFKGLKTAKKAAALKPREMPEINKDFNDLVDKLGQTQYQIFVLSADQERLNVALARINSEATARVELDKAAEVQSEATKSGAV